MATVTKNRTYGKIARLMGRNEEIYRGPYIDAFCQVWFHLA
jgi:hypothetical protein